MAERPLHAQEDWAFKTLGDARIFLWRWHPSITSLELIPSAERWLGTHCDCPMISLRTILKLTHPEDLNLVKLAIRGALLSPQLALELRIFNTDGAYDVIRCCGQLHTTDEGILSMSGTMSLKEDKNHLPPSGEQDITHTRFKTKANPPSEDENFRLIAEIATDYACGLEVSENSELKMAWSYGSRESLWGYDSSDFFALLRAGSIVHPDDRPLLRDCERSLLQGSRQRTRFRITTAGGDLRWISEISVPVLDESTHQVQSICCFAKDVTADVQRTEEIERAHDFLAKSNEAARIGTWELNLETGSVFWSKVTKDIHEVSKDYEANVPEAIGFYKEGESRDRISRVFNEAITKGESFDEDLIIVTDLGAERWVRAIGIPVMQNGQCVRCYGTFQDIDKQKRTLLEVKKLSMVASKISDSVVITDPDSLITWSNESFSNLTGFSSEEVVGKNPGHFLQGPETDEADVEKIRQGLKQKTHFVVELINYTKAGRPYWIELSITPVLNQYGAVQNFIGIERDVTERKTRERVLDENRENLSVMADRVPVIVLRYKILPSQEDMLLYINEGVEEVYEISKEEALDQVQVMWDRTHPDDYESLTSSVMKSAETSKPWDATWRILLSGGRMKWLHGRGVPKKNEDGSVVWDSMILDITDSKRAELDLKESRDNFEFLINTIDGVVWEANSDTLECTFVSEQIKKVLGYTSEEWVSDGWMWESLIHPEDRQQAIDIFQQKPRPTGQQHLEYRLKHKDQHYVWMRDVLRFDEGPEQSRLLGLMIDITEEKRAQIRLDQERERAQNILEGTGAGTWRWFAKEDKLEVNDNWLSIVARAEETNPLDLDLSTLRSWVHPEDRAHFEQEIQNHLDGKSDRIDIEYQITSSAGKRVWVHQRGKTVKFNEANRPLEVAGTLMDISARKEAEIQLRNTNDQLELALRTSKMGVWFKDVKHDELHFNDNLLEIFEVDRADFADNSGIWQQRLIEEDREVALSGLEKLFQGEAVESRFRITGRNGKIKHILVSGATVLDHQGQPERVIGLNMDVTAIIEQEERLRSTEQRLLMAAATGQVGIWEYDPELETLEINEDLAKILGYEFTDIEDHHEFFWRQMHMEDRRRMKEALHPSRHALVDEELRMRTSDGSWKWVLARGKHIDSQRKQYGEIAGVLVDITKLREAQEQLKETIKQKNSLFQELHHRIKNNLQLISSLMYLKETSVENEAIKKELRDSRSRISSMAQIHEQLLQLEEVDQLDIKVYLEQLSTQLLQVYALMPEKIDFNLEVESHILEIDQVLFIGLLVHEIVSNSLKYAYEPKTGGAIDIQFSKDRDYQLHVRDYGKGFDPKQRGHSFGIDLIDTFARQLGGVISFDGAHGAAYHIAFPSTN